MGRYNHKVEMTYQFLLCMRAVLDSGNHGTGEGDSA